MLDSEASQLRVSTGLAALDAALDGLYWGDNVVWDLDGGSADPFYGAIVELADAFDTRAHVSLAPAAETPAWCHGGDEVTTIDAGPSGRLREPAELLREIQRMCHVPRRRLLLFDSLDAMVDAWGPHGTRGFFARCCPMLLEASAIAYWTMSADHTPVAVRDTVRAVTQCVLRVDERSVRVTKAEGRADGVAGSVLHWHEEGGHRVLESASITGRVAASLRALRRARELSQHDLARLAGVTPSAISQAERGERGLSLTTMVRLSDALGITIDDLLRGEDPSLYRIGRRGEDPQHGLEPTTTLIGSAESQLRIDLVQLGLRQAGTPLYRQRGSGIVAVASGLVQITIGGQKPAVRQGEVLVADSERIERWRNIGHVEALLFWIVVAQPSEGRLHRPPG